MNYGVSATNVIEVLNERVVYFCATFGYTISPDDIFIDSIDCRKDDEMIFVKFRLRDHEGETYCWNFKR